MNCKQGDLAIIVASCKENLGLIVLCIRPTENLWRSRDGTIDDCPGWVIDRDVVDWMGGKDNHIEDACLRPIRNPGDDATDETLAWKPVPRLTREFLERFDQALIEQIWGAT
jgi:hypothetical protein